MLTATQKLICERVINVYETGTVEGRYGAISIYHDGPHGIRQITFGRSQTTEYGNLKELVQMYVEEGGTFSAALASYVDRIGIVALVDDASFKDLLRRAGNEDPAMRQAQDAFFDRRYFQPALDWAGSHGFTLALSTLVIYDSFIHSGGILKLLRARFPEKPPAAGGDEKTWIKQYVDVRNDWLANNQNPDVRPSAYRTKDFQREVAKGNWDLAMLPYIANGTPVDASHPPVGTVDVVPFLGTPAGDEEVWSELEPLGGLAIASAAAVSSDTAATLAQRILDSDRVEFARAHASGVNDHATAYLNIVDTAAGRAASRSSYGTAPGGTVNLDPAMLRGLLTLAEDYTFSVSELCGGSHNTNSRHYAGCTADINTINGQHISAVHPDVVAFQQRCRDLGATEVLGPGKPGHATHVHAGWPRP
ncbi:chitosanase [Mesorhizobium calcicola]|uniref:Chitosanase n=1 Tax=Mesorhizobium calcicola TaxID=1300310 RepID=A0ABW4WA67_9HYPH